jgi:hypothetical protein
VLRCRAQSPALAQPPFAAVTHMPASAVHQAACGSAVWSCGSAGLCSAVHCSAPAAPHTGRTAQHNTTQQQDPPQVSVVCCSSSSSSRTHPPALRHSLAGCSFPLHPGGTRFLQALLLCQALCWLSVCVWTGTSAPSWLSQGRFLAQLHNCYKPPPAAAPPAAAQDGVDCAARTSCSCCTQLLPVRANKGSQRMHA